MIRALALLIAAASTQTVFTFADAAITESSGLIDLGSLMVTVNDSGDDAVVYTVDPATGQTVGRTWYADEAVDVEALAPAGPGQVWVGDIGDNNAVRETISLYRVPVGRGDRQVSVRRYQLAYPGGPRDAESLVAIGGRLYVIAKGLFGGGVFLAPKSLRADRINQLVKVGEVSLFATDAAAFGDGRHVLVRGYGTAQVLAYPRWQRVATFHLPAQEQGEGISIGPRDRIRLSSEGAGSAVLQIDLPAAVGAAMSAPAPTPQITEVRAARLAGERTWVDARAVIGVGGAALLGGLLFVWGSRRRRAR